MAKLGNGLVVVPTVSAWRPGGDDPVLRLGWSAEGEPVGLAYSSARALVAAWHPGQPWVALPQAYLTAVLRAEGVGRLLVDGCPAALEQAGR